MPMAGPSDRSRHREAAIERLDKALAMTPLEVKAEMTEAVQALVRLRDTTIAEWRADPTAAARARLDHVNAILSLASGTENPMGGMKWERMKKTRDLLVRLRDEEDGPDAGARS